MSRAPRVSDPLTRAVGALLRDIAAADAAGALRPGRDPRAARTDAGPRLPALQP
ncbi:hypothetical protein ACIO1C_13480 [Streptomyces sp. NPDC087420]|uniref:hypothetical protein n=1 Tax=Streptomyces sp. NPDC087420 TaxID=3365785 RepID=UPI003834826E